MPLAMCVGYGWEVLGGEPQKTMVPTRPECMLLQEDLPKLRREVASRASRATLSEPLSGTAVQAGPRSSDPRSPHSPAGQGGEQSSPHPQAEPALGWLLGGREGCANVNRLWCGLPQQLQPQP